jgi:hypothetical protein
MEYSDSSSDELSFDQPVVDSDRSDDDSNSNGSFVLPPPPPPKEEKGYLERYLTKVLMNLTLTVNNVHIRYEDETYPFCHPFSFGISLDSGSIRSTPNAINFRELTSHSVITSSPRNVLAIKEGHCTNFFVYINSMSEMCIPTSLWEATLSSPIGIFEAFAAYELRELMVDETKNLSTGGDHCLLEPTTATCNIVLRDAAPKIKLALMLDDIRVRFTNSMFE